MAEKLHHLEQARAACLAAHGHAGGMDEGGRLEPELFGQGAEDLFDILAGEFGQGLQAVGQRAEALQVRRVVEMLLPALGLEGEIVPEETVGFLGEFGERLQPDLVEVDDLKDVGVVEGGDIGVRGLEVRS